MKRYDPDIEWFYGYEAIPEPVMVEAKDGEYVKLKDVQDILNKFKNE